MKATSIERDGAVIISGASIARNWYDRVVGLIGVRDLPDDRAVIFPGCNSIHTFFMRMNIDVLFVDEHGTIVDIVQNLAPWRIIWPMKGAKHVVEMKAFLSARLGVQRGQSFKCEGIWD